MTARQVACRSSVHVSRLLESEIGKRFRFTEADGSRFSGTLVDLAYPQSVLVQVGEDSDRWPEGWVVELVDATAVCVCDSRT